MVVEQQRRPYNYYLYKKRPSNTYYNKLYYVHLTQMFSDKKATSEVD